MENLSRLFYEEDLLASNEEADAEVDVSMVDRYSENECAAD